MSTDVIYYVAGFAFSQDYKNVALIRKKQPEWQKGLLNGIGGKVNAGENDHDAMIREFREETGATVSAWSNFCTLHGKTKDGQKWVVNFFKTTTDLNELVTTTDEEVLVMTIREAYKSKIIYNLRWLIAMALDRTLSFGEVFSL